MGTRKSTAKNDVVARVLGYIAGVKLHQTGETLVLNGESITDVALLAELEGYIAQLNATATAHAAWLGLVQTTRTMEATEMNPRLTALERYLEGTYGPTSPVLSDYGIKPAKPAKRTLKAKVTAAEKDAATRAARDTMGPRQKEAIHGTVPSEPAPAPASSPPEGTPPASSPPASSPVAPQVSAPSVPPKR
jgi:hypothetical protein